MKLLANLGLLLLLVLAMGAVATATVWTWRPDLVEAVDARWTSVHVDGVRQRLSALRALSRTDRDEAIEELEVLTDELRSYRKADRRFQVRCEALRLLADLHFDAGDLDSARETGEELLQQNENDVTGRLWFGRRLCAAESTRRQGFEVLEKLFSRLPELGAIARVYHDCARAAGEDALAADVLVRHLERALRPEQSLEGVTRRWRVWWSPDGEWSAERRLDVAALRYGAITAVGFELPEAARFLRLDPPARSHLAYGAPRLAVLEDDRPIRIPIPPGGLRRSGLHIDDDSLYVQGDSDPWVIVPLPEAHRDRPLRGRFVVQADRLPLWIGEAASTPAARAAISILPDSSRVRARAEEARAQLASLSGAR